MTAQGQRRRLDHWIRIDREGSVTAFSGKVEIGQGITTALAQIVADELDVSIECVRLAPVDTSYSPDEGVTAGSMSIEQSGQKLRHIAAELRGLLLNRAAARLGTNVALLAVVDGVIRTPDGAGMTYGELVDDELLARDATSGFPPKISAARSLIGGRVPRVDLVSKVAGRRSYVQDLALPSMLHGRVVRPPSQAANLTFIDEDEVRRLPGVIALVRDRNFLAIIAQGEYEAVRALARARQIALWEEPSAFPLSTDPRYLLTALSEDNVAVDRRDEGALARRQRTLSATYSRPFIAHGALAPSCAVALLEDERYTVWTHSQGVYPLRHELGKVLEVLPETVRVIHMEGAGCYGHNGADDAALDAALLARAVPGRAVRVQWMRDDEFAWEPYGTAAVLRLSAALDEKGEIVDWTLDVWGHGHGSRPNPSLPDDTTSLLAGQHLARRFRPAVAPRAGSLTMGALRNAESIYRLRNQRVVDHHVPRSPIRVSALRSLGAHANVFAIESFMDELAEAAGSDCIAFRLAHLQDLRARAVIQTVAERAGWRPREKGDGSSGRGIGFARYKNSAAYFAVVAEVRLATDIRVTRVWGAIDAGMAVSPDGLANQAEGGILQAISWTLKEQVRVEGTRITSLGWDSYPSLTFSEVPEVDVTVIDRPEDPPLGAGEAFAGPVSAAIANAIYNAAGVRLRDLPLTRDRLIGAMP